MWSPCVVVIPTEGDDDGHDGEVDDVLIKVLLMVGIGAVALLFLRGHATARHQAVRRVLMVGFVGLAVLSLLFPDSWTAVAGLLGVGRGTDLLLYATIVVVLGFMATSYLRTRDLQRQVTVLSRRLALDEAVAAHGLPVREPAAAAPDDVPVFGPAVRPGAAEVPVPRTPRSRRPTSV